VKLQYEIKKKIITEFGEAIFEQIETIATQKLETIIQNKNSYQAASDKATFFQI